VALGAALTLASSPAAAQNFFWQLPGGGDVWTAGTTHTIEWTGGPAGTATLELIRLSPLSVAGTIATLVPNTGFAQWAIPANLTPGGYQIYIEDTARSTWSYSYEVDIDPAPACAASCVLTSYAMPFTTPPAGVCGANGLELDRLGQSWVQSHFACPPGYEVDPSSMTIDVTFLPIGVCLSGYGGPFIAEAAAVACCCATSTGASRSTWGRVKSIYR
jgi:hypothetical protein